MACNVLYNHANITSLTQSVLTAANTCSTVNDFFDTIMKNEERTFKSVRYSADMSDDEFDAQESFNALTTDLASIVSQYADTLKDKFNLSKDNLINILNERMSLYMHDTSDTKIQSQDVGDLITSIHDETFAEYKNHVYSGTAISAFIFFDTEFARKIYQSVFSNVSLSDDTKVQSLNEIIHSIKNEYFKTIVGYLKSTYPDSELVKNITDVMYKNGKLDNVNFTLVIDFFSKLITSTENISEKINNEYLDMLDDEAHPDKTTHYKDLIQYLLTSNNTFKRWFYKKFSGISRNAAMTELFDQGLYSSYYTIIKNYCSKRFNDDPDFKSRINAYFQEIERPSYTLLNAVNAYTTLCYFDDMLQSKFKEEIIVTKGLQNVEGGVDKYRFSRTLTDQLNNWKDDTNMQAESHLSKLVDVAYEIIPIRAYDNGKIIQNSMTSTIAMNVTLKFFNDIKYNRINPHVDLGRRGEKNSFRDLFNELMECIMLIPTDSCKYVQRAFEILFTEVTNDQNNTSVVFIDTFENDLSEYEKSVLHSLYENIFSRENSESIFSKELETQSFDSDVNRSIYNEICSSFNSSYSAEYMTEENGEIRSLNDKTQVINLAIIRDQINAWINNIDSLSARKELKNKYFIKAEKISGQSVDFTFKTGDNIFTLHVPIECSKLMFDETFVSDSKSMYFTLEDGSFDVFLERMLTVDPLQLRRKSINNENLTNDENSFVSILEFLDDNLGTHFNSYVGFDELRIMALLCPHGIDGFNTYLEALLKLAIKAQYVNALYIQADNSPLSDYLINKKNPIYLAEQNVIDKNNSGTVFRKYGNAINAIIIPSSSDVLTTLGYALNIARGETMRGTLKDNLGNIRPKNSTKSFMSNVPMMWFNDTDASPSAVSLYSSLGTVLSIQRDLETSVYGINRNVKDMNPGELYMHCVLGKFWGKLFQAKNSDSVFVQPLNYSDSKGLINFEIQLPQELRDVLKPGLNYKEKILQDFFIRYIGPRFTEMYNDITNVQNQIVARYQKIHRISKKKFDKLTLNQKMHLITPEEFIKIGVSLNLEVVNEYHFRIFKTNDGDRCGVNEQILYEQKLFNNRNLLDNMLEKAKKEFLADHLNYEITYNIFNALSPEFQDISPKNLKFDFDSSDSQLMKILKSIFKNDFNGFKKYFFEEEIDGQIDPNSGWIDLETGDLILAKYFDKQSHDWFAVDYSHLSQISEYQIILNPLLDIYFYTDSYLSEGLRLTTMGTSNSLPPAKGELWSLIKSACDSNDTEKINDVFKQYLSLDLASNPLLKFRSHFANLIETIRNCDDLNDFQEKVFPLLENSDSERLNAEQKIYLEILNRLMLFNLSTRYRSQSKRAMSMATTSLSDLQGTYLGQPPKVRCAVIEDMTAPVFDFEGNESTIESADGSIRLNPFQSVIEANSRGAHYDGQVKKTVMAIPDKIKGIMSYVKCASFAITNETMRTSLMSEISDHDIFKKMTNLQWSQDKNTSQYEINLCDFIDYHPITRLELKNVFDKIITCNRGLYYLDDGVVKKINALGSIQTNLGNIYYTEEIRCVAGDPILLDTQSVYHIFYDEADNASIHMKLTSLDEVNAFVQKLAAEGKNPHTINSLYELHSALGGIYSCNNVGVYNESNIYAVVNYMNNIGHYVDGYDSSSLKTAYTTIQPLKSAHISYLINQSAIKCGARNVNTVSSWTDSNPLMEFDLQTIGIGQQLNPEENIEYKYLSELTQVMTNAAGRGWNYKTVSSLLNNLAQTAFNTCKPVRTAVDNFAKAASLNSAETAKFKSELYDEACRILFEYNVGYDNRGMFTKIVENVESVFKKYANHDEDTSKLPFDDPSVLRKITTSVAKCLNEAIRRKYPGSQDVISPSYKIMQYYEVYDSEGQIYKMNSNDLVNAANEVYKEKLEKLCLSRLPSEKFKGSIHISENRDAIAKLLPIKELEKIALSTLKPGETLPWYLESTDANEINRYRCKCYLNYMAQNIPFFNDPTYFIPSDVVDVFVEEEPSITTGQITYRFVETVRLDSLTKYFDFKQKYTNKEGYHFRASANQPRDLRPSVPRWKCITDDGVEFYMNFFDLVLFDELSTNDYKITKEYSENVSKHFRLISSFNKGVQLSTLYDDKTYVDNTKAQPDIFDIAGTLSKQYGHFTFVKGSLENKPMEYIGPYRFREEFGLDQGMSLFDVLKQGQAFFENQVVNLNTPIDRTYDIAFMKHKGTNTYVLFNETEKINLRFTNLYRSSKSTIDGNIYHVDSKGQRKLLIGKWVATTDVIYDGQTNEFKHIDGHNVPQDRYRISSSNIVEERIDLVKRAKRIQHDTNSNIISSTYYIIADQATFTKAFGQNLNIEQARAEIIESIFNNDNFDIVQINPNIYENDSRRSSIVTSLNNITGNQFVDVTLREFINNQIELINSLTKNNDNQTYKNVIKSIRSLKKEYISQFAHRKYTSFLDSYKILSARIPGQGFQSWNGLDCVGFTQHMSNMIYVSHFQLYLQGSDMDVDKDNNMSQSYDTNGRYIDWSPYFNYFSLKTLESSKLLPLPSAIEAIDYDSKSHNDTAYIVTPDIVWVDLTTNAILDSNGYLVPNAINENSISVFIDSLTTILNNLNLNEGKLDINTSYALSQEIQDFCSRNHLSQTQFKNVILNTINRHNLYQIHPNNIIAASKNAVMASAYAISMDLSNRNYQYKPDSTSLFKEAAAENPNNTIMNLRHPLNPFSKMYMQNDNLMAKDCVGIIANQCKTFYRYFQYWMDATNKRGTRNIELLRFEINIQGIEGRADNENKQSKINMCFDLPFTQGVTSLLEALELIPRDSTPEEYIQNMRDIDLKLSQYLSQAADNAKDPLLTLLKADKKLAAQWIAAIMLGFDIRDVAAYMSSPVVEFISNKGSYNIYNDKDTFTPYSQIFNAIELVEGNLNPRKRLYGSILVPTTNSQSGTTIPKLTPLASYVRHILWNKIDSDSSPIRKAFIDEYTKDGSVYSRKKPLQIVEITKTLCKLYLQNPDKIDIDSIFKYDGENKRIIKYFKEIKNLFENLHDLVESYDGKNYEDKYQLFINDLETFKTLTEIADEATSIANEYLHYNTGLSSTPSEILHKLVSMRNVFTERERVLGISPDIFEDPTKMAQVIKKIHKRAPFLSSSQIRAALNEANNAGLINQFDPMKMLLDETYRRQATDYLHVIKRMYNALDIVYSSAQNTSEMEILKSEAFLLMTFSSAYKNVYDYMVHTNKNFSVDQVKKLIATQQKHTIHSFIKTLPSISIPEFYGNVMGFTANFDLNLSISEINFSTQEGIASFVHFVEQEFMGFLRKNYPSNPMLRHIVFTGSGLNTKLSFDISMTDENGGRYTEIGYNDIINGMSHLSLIRFNDNYTLADIFFIYNLLRYNNSYGGSTFTNAFSGIDIRSSVMNNFYTYIGNTCYDGNAISQCDENDFEISIAPEISAFRVTVANNGYAWITDNIWGKKLVTVSNGRSKDHPLCNNIFQNESETSLQNTRETYFRRYYPYATMPGEHVDWGNENILLFKLEDINKNNVNEITVKDDVVKKIAQLLDANMEVHKLFEYLNCY